jgi:hypothetical protein
MEIHTALFLHAHTTKSYNILSKQLCSQNSSSTYFFIDKEKISRTHETISHILFKECKNIIKETNKQ